MIRQSKDVLRLIANVPIGDTQLFAMSSAAFTVGSVTMESVSSVVLTMLVTRARIAPRFFLVSLFAKMCFKMMCQDNTVHLVS